MSDEKMFTQKLLTAAKSTIVAWGLLCVTCLLLSNMKGTYLPIDPNRYSPYPVQKSFFEAISPILSQDMMLRGFLILVLLVVGTWRNYIVGFWSEISGSKNLYYGYPLFCITGAFLLPSVTSSWLWLRGYLSDMNHWMVILWVIAAIRIAWATILTIRLRRREAISMGFIGGYLGSVALLMGVTICSAVYLVTPYLGLLSSTYSIPTFQVLLILIGFVVLWTPFVRILLGVHYLNVNRHRTD